jgi:hypothetical protein
VFLQLDQGGRAAALEWAGSAAALDWVGGAAVLAARQLWGGLAARSCDREKRGCGWGLGGLGVMGFRRAAVGD